MDESEDESEASVGPAKAFSFRPSGTDPKHRRGYVGGRPKLLREQRRNHDGFATSALGS